MSTTIITKKCSKCGYSTTKRVYGYVNDPMGVPVAQCPLCGQISAERSHKEWIQMSPLAKAYAIYPRAGVYGLFGGFLITVLSCRDIFAKDVLGDMDPWILLGAFLTAALLVIYVTLCIAVNSSFFLNRYIASVKRTRNPGYRQFVCSLGKCYDEKLPLLLRFSEKSLSDIDFNLRSPTLDVDVRIPSLDDSITNA